MIQYKTADTQPELLAILDLQKANLGTNLTASEALDQGFVTVYHTLEELDRLNTIERHIIAKDEEKVAAYVLAMTAQSKFEMPVLVPMFEMFAQVSYQEKLITDYSYLVVGQVCVDKNYRGQGIFDEVYKAYKKHYQGKYDFAITEVATKNLRSMKAHNRIGFKEIHRFIAPDDVEWSMVLWDWQN
ncbi:GNAT family N-acetyltransferase [Pedobacter punctiformis]|uniref:GNAT family N-acetyltransferase n=1 Tax=Pedobacter punctiformis TaxID=3004097 RepID=A0ABT4L9G4_9SPHI|nr:GNAT family N-acetyltransferase [Pedobacter sp. HCMS5-2]MCZ4244481.1 GNAT family N-acetyltransferase [Pedobacter sp. HCMS5-2]